MDTTDIKILTFLHDNARATASEIAEQLGLSVSTIGERIKKMESSGIIKGYTAIIDARKLGKDVTAIMSVTLEHPKYSDEFVAQVAANPQITECLYIAGDFDYHLKIVTDNTRSLERVLNEIKSIRGVSKTKTNLVLSIGKNDYSVVPSIKKSTRQNAEKMIKGEQK